jgi:YggT family protein
MEEIMRFIFGILASAAGIYSILLFIRIIISWFGGLPSNKLTDLLAKVTDPYLDWWKAHLNLRIGFLDFSALAAIVAVSVAQNIFYSISNSGVLKFGFVLAIILLSIWSVVFFVLGFCLVIIILRLIAYLTNRNTYSPFWRVIDSMSQPVLYRINRILFGRRIVGYLKGIILSSIVLAALMVGGRIFVPILAAMISKLPV